MKLKTNSISSKLYRYFYGTNLLPDNLCEYFWKLVIAYIFIIPTSIIYLPIILTEIYNIITNQSQRNDLHVIEKILFSVIIYLGLFFIVAMLSLIGLFFIPLEKESFFGFLIQVGILTWAILIIVAIVWGVFKLIDYCNKKPYKPNKTSIIKEYILAKKNKYCPRIDWE